MRRSILVAGSAIALAGAMAIGPFGAAAAAPYVYGCTPATVTRFSTQYLEQLNIYNGSAGTANLTTKILDAIGTILNSAVSMPLTSTLPPTQTFTYGWGALGGNVGTPGVPASIRIVSNVPVSATLSHDMTLVVSNEWKSTVCTPQQP
jgi:hypothetical protein